MAANNQTKNIWALRIPAFGSVLFFSSCASTTVPTKSFELAHTPTQPLVVSIPTPPAQLIESAPEEESEMDFVFKTQNDLVEKWIKFYTQKDTDRFQRHLNRATPYEKVVKQILKSHGLPEEIFYLGIVESGYRTDAKSHAQAVGVWQFIRGTGKRYGLKMNSYVDERRDPYRSTEAAALYLKDLYNVFNSWELALAAYNAGEGRILRAVMAGKSRNFWTLAEKGVLPDETMNYVPKFIAAAVIGERPKKYGFRKDPSLLKLPELEIVEIPHSTRISEIARLANVPVQDVIQVNPQLLRGITPPFERNYHLWVPKLHSQKIGYAVKSLPARNIVSVNAQIQKQNELWGSRKSFQKKTKPLVYRVKRGDNLQRLSQKFNVSIEEILKKNSKKSAQIYAGELIKVPK